MERPKFSLNLINMLLCISLLMAFTLSCTQIKGIAGLNKQTKEQNEFYYNIPYGYKNTEEDKDAWRETSFVILMPDSERIFVGKMDGQPLDVKKLGEAVKAFAADRWPDKRTVYIAASNEVSKEAFALVIDELRKNDIIRVRLLTSSAERPKGISGDDTKYEESMGDIPLPDSVMEFKVVPEPAGQSPNPMTLVLTLDKKNGIMLNNQSVEEKMLATRISSILKSRELNHVRRVGTNEIYNSVYFPLDKSPNEISPSGIKYVELVNILAVLKDAGASVFLSQPEPCCRPTLQPEPDISSQDSPPIKQIDEPLPKTISGGVLNGKATSLPKPEYPAAAKAVRATGMVNVQIKVDTTGKVVEANAVSGHPLLRPAAVQAAKASTFNPTLLSGAPVNVTGILTYNFKQ